MNLHHSFSNSFQKQAFFELCDELLKKGNELTFTVVSDCMAPLIEQGDEIKVRYAHPEKNTFGDVVLYKAQEGFITHRIIGKRFVNGKKLFLHKGDNSRHAATIPAEQVIAKAVLIKKADRCIRLDTTRGKLVNYIFGFRSIFSVFIRQRCVRKFVPPFEKGGLGGILRNCLRMIDFVRRKDYE